jgi:hypothetical protein
MAWGSVNAFVVVVHTSEPLSDEEWDGYLQFCLGAGVEHGVKMSYLAVTEGGAPNTAQRRRFHDLVTPILEKHPGFMRGAIVTPSTFVRGVVTAMSLVNRVYKAFSHSEMKESYAYLGVPAGYIGQVEALIVSLKASLRDGGPVDAA